MNWADMDGMAGLHNTLKRYEVKNSELLAVINDIWGMNIVRV